MCRKPLGYSFPDFRLNIRIYDRNRISRITVCTGSAVRATGFVIDFWLRVESLRRLSTCPSCQLNRKSLEFYQLGIDKQ